MVMSLTASAQQPGKWQLTRFDQAGQPWGDTQYETKGEALLEFLSDADVSTVRDFGGQFNQRDRPFGGEEVVRAPLDTVRTDTPAFRAARSTTSACASGLGAAMLEDLPS